MTTKCHILPLTLFMLLFVSCDNNVVSRVEYDAVAAHADSLEAQIDSLQFELSDLRLYNCYLEKFIDSMGKGQVEAQ